MWCRSHSTSFESTHENVLALSAPPLQQLLLTAQSNEHHNHHHQTFTTLSYHLSHSPHSLNHHYQHHDKNGAGWYGQLNNLSGLTFGPMVLFDEKHPNAPEVLATAVVSPLTNIPLGAAVVRRAAVDGCRFGKKPAEPNACVWAHGPSEEITSVSLASCGTTPQPPRALPYPACALMMFHTSKIVSKRPPESTPSKSDIDCRRVFFCSLSVMVV